MLTLFNIFQRPLLGSERTLFQVIVGSFTYSGAKAKIKAVASNEADVEGEPAAIEKPSTPSGGGVGQNLPSPLIGGWVSSRPMDLRNSPIDIDLTRG